MGEELAGSHSGEAGEVSEGFGATGGASTLHLILQEGATEGRGHRDPAHTQVSRHLVAPISIGDFCLFYQINGFSMWNQMPSTRC